MDRRRFLAGSGAAASLLLAGCSSTSDEETSTSVTTSTTSGESKSSDGSQELVSENRTGPVSVTYASLSFDESVRYYDPKAESLRQARPNNGWWASVSVRFQNLLGDSVPYPEPSSLQLIVDGETYQPQYGIRGLTEEMLRPTGSSSFSWPSQWSEYLADEFQPGATATLQPLYDVPSGSQLLVSWSYQGETGKVEFRDSELFGYSYTS